MILNSFFVTEVLNLKCTFLLPCICKEYIEGLVALCVIYT